MSPSNTNESKPDVIGVRIEKDEAPLVMDALRKELLILSKKPKFSRRYKTLYQIYQKMEDAWTKHINNSSDVGFGE